MAVRRVFGIVKGEKLPVHWGRARACALFREPVWSGSGSGSPGNRGFDQYLSDGVFLGHDWLASRHSTDNRDGYKTEDAFTPEFLVTAAEVRTPSSPATSPAVIAPSCSLDG